jgi:acyl carrier protein
MQAMGAKVLIERCDVAEKSAVDNLFKRLSKSMPPVKTVIHCAMVLEDGLLQDVNEERLKRVMLPKVMGAWNLHEATHSMELDNFWCISSISSLIGNIGQATYVAANAWLDGFAHYRRGLGLPAHTFNLGVVDAVGVVARDGADVARLLDQSGIRPMSAAAIFDQIKQVCSLNITQAGIFAVDWDALKTRFNNFADYSRFSKWMQSSGTQNSVHSANQEALANLTFAEQLKTVESMVSEEIANILKIPVDQIERTRRVDSLGIDSLIAVELERKLQKRIGVRVASVDFLGGVSIAQLAENFLNLLEVPVLNAQSVDDMSEAELDAMIEELSNQKSEVEAS